MVKKHQYKLNVGDEMLLRMEPWIGMGTTGIDQFQLIFLNWLVGGRPLIWTAPDYGLLIQRLEGWDYGLSKVY